MFLYWYYTLGDIHAETESRWNYSAENSCEQLHSEKLHI